MFVRNALKVVMFVIFEWAFGSYAKFLGHDILKLFTTVVSVFSSKLLSYEEYIFLVSKSVC